MHTPIGSVSKDIGKSKSKPSLPPTSDRPSLARQRLVPRAVGPPGRRPKAAPLRLGPPQAAQGGHLPLEPQQAGPSRVDVVKRSLRKRGFSKAVSSRIARPNRSFTLAGYQSKWKIFVAWCGERQTDPLTASAPSVADFLVEKFESGLAPSTLAGYITAIAKTLVPSTGVDLGENADLSALLHNFETFV